MYYRNVTLHNLGAGYTVSVRVLSVLMVLGLDVSSWKRRTQNGEEQGQAGTAGYNGTHVDVSPPPPSLQHWRWRVCTEEAGTLFHGPKHAPELRVS